MYPLWLARCISAIRIFWIYEWFADSFNVLSRLQVATTECVLRANESLSHSLERVYRNKRCCVLLNFAYSRNSTNSDKNHKGLLMLISFISFNVSQVHSVHLHIKCIVRSCSGDSFSKGGVFLQHVQPVKFAIRERARMLLVRARKSSASKRRSTAPNWTIITIRSL